MDRGFYAISVVRILKQYGIRFVIGAPKTRGIKKVLEGVPKDGRIYTMPYEMSSSREKERVTLFMRWDQRKREWFVAIGSGVGVKRGEAILKALGDRNGVSSD